MGPSDWARLRPCVNGRPIPHGSALLLRSQRRPHRQASRRGVGILRFPTAIAVS